MPRIWAYWLPPQVVPWSAGLAPPLWWAFRARLNVGMATVREIGDRLYALPPAAFTAARDEAVGEARQAGDRDAATEVAALKRPTQAAWLVNLLALARPDIVTELIELGDAIRSAQGTVPPTQLRDLSARRRRALDAALAASQDLARGAGAPAPTRAMLDEVEGTLAAAMADEAAAGTVRSGRVLKPLRYSGFGDGLVASTTAVPRTSGAARSSSARASSPSAPVHTGAPQPSAEELEALAAARRQEALARVAEAERAVDDTTAAERAATAEVDSLTADLAALRERLDHAQAQARAARQKRIAAERDYESAQRRARAAGA